VSVYPVNSLAAFVFEHCIVTIGDGIGAGEQNLLEDLDNGKVAVGTLLVIDSWKSF